MAFGVHHVHIKTPDPTRTMQFYVDHFGATPIGEVGARGYRVSLSGLTLNITTIVDGQTRAQHHGLEHIAVDTADYAGAVARLRAAGVRILEELAPTSGRHVCFVEAPDGVQIELIEKAPVAAVTQRRLLICDSQVHIWAADTPERPWPPGRASQAQKPYPVDREALLFQMDLAGVSRAVLVPPSWEGERNDLALDAARAYPDRFAVMGRLPIHKPESRTLVPEWKKQPGMLGMRFTFHTELMRPWLTDGTADWLWPAAERHSIPLMVLVPGSLDVIDRVAERHPGLRLTIDHVGLDRLKGPNAFGDLPKVCALAKRPNVAVKASGMPSLSQERYPFRDLHDPIRRLVDAFGPRRVFWGTDLTRMPCTYHECIALFTEHLPWLAGEDLEWVMGRSVCEWLGWSLPAS